MKQISFSVSCIDTFDQIVDQQQSRLAIADDGKSLSYSELSQAADDIASALRDSCTTDGPVAILLSHEVRFPAAILGALAAGHGFVPLDSDHPVERNGLIAAHAGAVASITSSRLRGVASQIFDASLPIIDIDAVARTSTRVRKPRNGDDLAWILYTSGSSGTPKGVYQDENGLMCDLKAAIDWARIAPDDHLPLFYSPTAAAGLRITLSALFGGASLYVMTPSQLGPEGMARRLMQRPVTIWRSSPTLFRRVADGLPEGGGFESVRLVLLGGERVGWSDIDVVRKACPSAEIGVHLGSTESSIHTHWIVNDALREGERLLPVGQTADLYRVDVVDPHGRFVADGDIGECRATGPCVARGYWRDPDATAAAFTIQAGAAERTVLTGDLVRRRADGRFEYVGRKDFQVKIAGRRVEPEEVEEVLRTCMGVRDAAVIAQQTSDRNFSILVAFVERHEGFRGLLARHVRSMAAQRLPEHMVPARVTILDELPRLPTFKIDRQRLRDMDARHHDESSVRVKGTLSDQVATIFEDVIGVTGVASDDNLSSLGGDSLQAVVIAARLEKEFGTTVRLGVVSNTASIGELAEWVHMQQLLAQSREEQSGSGAGGLVADPRTSRIAAPGTRVELISYSTRVLDEATRLRALISENRLAEARSCARELARSNPSIPSFVHVADVLDFVPESDDIVRFRDDLKWDVQVVVRPGASTTVFVFCDAQHAFGLPLDVVHQWFGRMSASVVYLRDFNQMHYFDGIRSLGADRLATRDALASIASERGGERVVCVGTSGGTAAALRYGLDLRADAVIAFAGWIDFSRTFNRYLRSAAIAEELAQLHTENVGDLPSAYQQACQPPRVLIVYGDSAWDDRLHAERMRGVNGVKLLPVQDCSRHNVIPELIGRSWLSRLLDWSMMPDGVSLPESIPLRND